MQRRPAGVAPRRRPGASRLRGSSVGQHVALRDRPELLASRRGRQRLRPDRGFARHRGVARCRGVPAPSAGHEALEAVAVSMQPSSEADRRPPTPLPRGAPAARRRGLSTAEVARITGLGVPAVKTRLPRSRADACGRPSPAHAPRAPREPRAGAPTSCGSSPRHLEGDISARTCARMEEHLSGCARCQAACDGLSRCLRMCRTTPSPPRSRPSCRTRFAAPSTRSSRRP